MSTNWRNRGHFPTGALILIALGCLWLYANSHPEVDAWYIVFHYWPVILILLGLGHLIDFALTPRPAEPSVAGGAPPPVFRPRTGEILAVVLLILFLVWAIHSSPGNHKPIHDFKDAALSGATSLNVSLELPAGNLNVASGASSGSAAQANFIYDPREGAPQWDYSVNGTAASLDVTQSSVHTHFSTRQNAWDVRLNGDVLSSLHINVGAGETKLRFKDLGPEIVDVQIGAGSLDADLAGNWKQDADITIQGGVGSAVIHIPSSVGVSVHTEGGLGVVQTDGLKRDDDHDWHNDALGKNPVTLHVSVKGGIGEIRLVPEL
ncbi:MAG: toast rack family protein [Candidatus Acidiferrales bacterium]